MSKKDKLRWANMRREMKAYGMLDTSGARENFFCSDPDCPRHDF